MVGSAVDCYSIEEGDDSMCIMAARRLLHGVVNACIQEEEEGEGEGEEKREREGEEERAWWIEDGIFILQHVLVS